MIRNEKGIALILVLWVLTLLTVIVGQFCYTTRTETNITRNFRDETTGYYLARGGMNQAILKIIEQINNPRPVEPEKETATDDNLTSSGKELNRPWRVNADIPAVPLPGGWFKVRIDNESGKFNINTADTALLYMMLDKFELPVEQRGIIVDSIADWRDKDSLHRANGAENDYYMSLPEPYQCSNSPFRTVNELLLVRGVTRELFDRGLKNMVSIYSDPEEKDKSGGKNLSTWESNQKAEKEKQKINVNAAPPQVLFSLPKMTGECLQAIMTFREKKDIRSHAELVKITGPEIFNGIFPYITYDYSSYYKIQAAGAADGFEVRPAIEALVRFDKKKEGYHFIQWLDYVTQTQ
ncbi:MAG: general secretion pathway protein GspK [Deltaproteobacteria bacterium]|nr:general secretion pathway protein GspK [Deltaproteobacteria bacterium]